MIEPALEVALPNVGPGPDSLALTDLIDPVEPADPTTAEGSDPAYESIVLLLHRDHHAGQCRRQVRAVADRYDEFRERGCAVVSVVPGPRERVREWQERYGLPYPIRADPDATLGDTLDQPVRLGPVGRRFDLVGRMPAAIVFDVGGPAADDLEIVAAYRRTIFDRPEIDALLDHADRRS
ncbi:redoxin domain-containing protein [Natrinema sp. DC36]|uniref:peroxiredoxin family protein n=1 Tax=Natrinema sp. DC36 TaxID=2878680 RepID=UPI001CF0CDC0|nr:redoxin domain-containing protein [Natrinema sp. DC36]